MKHPVFFIEVWKRGGGLVIRSEKTDSAERAKRMALDMKETGGAVWSTVVTVERPDGSLVAIIADYELDRLDSIAGAQ